MQRDEMLSLLRRRTGSDSIVDLLGRRHPEVEAPEDLIRLAVGLMSEADDVAARLAQKIPELSQPCRDLLRLQLLGRSSDEISEQLEVDADALYRRCRRRLFPNSKPLPNYEAFLVQALTDQPTFDSVRDELMLSELLQNSNRRALLLEATEDVRFTIAGSLREWFERPKSKVLVGLGSIAGLSILFKNCGGG